MKKSIFRLKQSDVFNINGEDPVKIISNESMLDETAIEFLYFDPKRIKLFSMYPENWQELTLEYGKTSHLAIENFKMEFKANFKEIKKILSSSDTISIYDDNMGSLRLLRGNFKFSPAPRFYRYKKELEKYMNDFI